MRQILTAILILIFWSDYSAAATRDWLYDGKEIYVHVKKNYVTTLIFPEPITGVIRGFGADSYVIQRDARKTTTLDIMPTDSEVAEMTVSGKSGEDYVLRCIANADFDTKLTITTTAQANKDMQVVQEDLQTKKSENINTKEFKEIIPPKDNLPEGVLLKQQPTVDPVVPKTGDVSGIPVQDNEVKDSELPAALNLKITLKGNDLPLKIYFSTISQVTGYNVITTPEIESQHTSINLENIEVWRALKSLLYKFGWGFKVSKEDLIITSMETRVYNIRMPAVEQTFLDETSNESYADSQNNTSSSGTSNNNQQNQNIKVGTKITYDNSAPKISLWNDLENAMKSLLTPQVGTYSISRSTGTIIVTDKPGVLDKVAEVIDSTNENISRQQTFEIQIYEVTLNDSSELGIDWQAVQTSLKGQNVLNLASNFSSVGFAGGQLLSIAGGTNSSGNNGVTAFLKALATQGDVHTISKPKITVTNLFPAIIQSVTSIPYISGTGSTISTDISQTNVTTSEVSEGLTMRLDAKISDDNKTDLNISVAENTLDSITSVPAGNGVNIQEPQVSTKSITTNVDIDPDKTVVLGGLISTTKNTSTQGVPVLSKLPYLGNLFSYKSSSVTRNELIIIISPKEVTRNSF